MTEWNFSATIQVQKKSLNGTADMLISVDTAVAYVYRFVYEYTGNFSLQK